MHRQSCCVFCLIDTLGLTCYAIFWTAQLPFLLVSPQRIRYLFLVKSILVPAAWLAIFIWSVTRVPTSVSLEPDRTTLSGSRLSWAWLSALNTAIAGYCTLSVNIPDFTVSDHTLGMCDSDERENAALRKE